MAADACGRGVETSLVKWVATHYAPQGIIAAHPKAVLTKTFTGVAGAGGLKPAGSVGAEKGMFDRRKNYLVKTHQPYG